MAEDRKYLTAFITHKGVFQYLQMPYGLCSAPSAFQKIVSCVHKGIYGCVTLLDDIIIHGHTQEQNDTRLQLVLTRLTKTNVPCSTWCVYHMVHLL